MSASLGERRRQRIPPFPRPPPSRGYTTHHIPTIARANHSCSPNAEYSYLPHVGRPDPLLIAIKDIAVGEEICQAYVDIFVSRADRREELQRYHGFVCVCDPCCAFDGASEDMIKKSDENRKEIWTSITAQGFDTLDGLPGTKVPFDENYEKQVRMLKLMDEENLWTPLRRHKFELAKMHSLVRSHDVVYAGRAVGAEENVDPAHIVKLTMAEMGAKQLIQGAGQKALELAPSVLEALKMYYGERGNMVCDMLRRLEKLRVEMEEMEDGTV